MWALRAQTDKLEYAAEMRRVLEATPNLYIREAMVTGVHVLTGVTALVAHRPHICCVSSLMASSHDASNEEVQLLLSYVLTGASIERCRSQFSLLTVAAMVSGALLLQALTSAPMTMSAACTPSSA